MPINVMKAVYTRVLRVNGDPAVRSMTPNVSAFYEPNLANICLILGIGQLADSVASLMTIVNTESV